MKKICVFAGSNAGVSPEYEQAAMQLGQWIAANQYELIYGGSKIGLMGRVANTVLEAGGTVIGVMPRNLFTGEMVHKGLTKLYEVNSMHERKALMSELCDAYVSLPGGLGTYEELFEVLSWSQLGIHKKPVGLLNVRGFYDPLMAMLQKTVDAGFMRESNLSLVECEAQVETLLEKMNNYVPAAQTNKWDELPSQAAQ